MAGGQMMAHFQPYFSLSLSPLQHNTTSKQKKKQRQSWTPTDKTYWIRTCMYNKIKNWNFNQQQLLRKNTQVKCDINKKWNILYGVNGSMKPWVFFLYFCSITAWQFPRIRCQDNNRPCSAFRSEGQVYPIE